MPAEALSPKVITAENGHQVLRIALRTETGTVVYATLGAVEADVYANRIGRMAYAAKRHNEGLPAARAARAAAEAWLQPGSLAEQMVAMVQERRGQWTEEQFAEGLRRFGYDVTPFEADKLMREMAEHDYMREVGTGRYVTLD